MVQVQVKATAKQVRISPRKIGLVASLVRGRSVADSLVILQHTPKRGAGILREVIKSAQANAEHNHKLDAKTLEVATINVSPGTIIKRGSPVAKGSYHRINKRTSHITVVVETPEIPVPAPTVTKPAAKPAKQSAPKGKK